MGEVARLLYSAELESDQPAHYAGKRSIELAETLHHHERNVRLEYDARQFGEMIEAFRGAHEEWSIIRYPAMSGKTVYLDLSDIPPAPSVTPRRFDIEESTYPTLDETTIHLHLRNLRIEFSHAEWEEFAFGVMTALMAWTAKP